MNHHYEVNIDRFVLTDTDLTPAQAEQLRQALTAELQHLLQQTDSLPQTAVSTPQMILPPLPLGAATNANTLAPHIAQALTGGQEGSHV